MPFRYPGILYVCFLISIGIISEGSYAMAIEEPVFTVLESKGDFELRKYPSFIVAETYVEGNFEEVGSEGFRRLADYIGGKNKKRSSISMTAPVSQTSESEKIAMTAPVSQKQEGNRWRITFVMPSKYSLENLPEPDDDRIKITKEQPKIVAVIRYSGTWGKKRYTDHETKLTEWIAEKGWKTVGEPLWARYDPPFMPWFLRRNEIMIPVDTQPAQ
jgi:hypothetical protein